MNYIFVRIYNRLKYTIWVLFYWFHDGILFASFFIILFLGQLGKGFLFKVKQPPS